MKTNLAATTALASSLVLLAAIGLPAKAAPSFDLKSVAGATTGMVELVGHGGGGHGGEGHGGGGQGGGGGGHTGHSMSAMGHGGHNGGDHMGKVGSHAYAGMSHDMHGGHHGHHGPSVAWKGGDWDHHGHDHDHFDHHHHHHNFFANDIFFVYGLDYGYNECAWLRRQAIITGSPYWWRRYQQCLY